MKTYLVISQCQFKFSLYLICKHQLVVKTSGIYLNSDTYNTLTPQLGVGWKYVPWVQLMRRTQVSSLSMLKCSLTTRMFLILENQFIKFLYIRGDWWNICLQYAYHINSTLLLTPHIGHHEDYGNCLIANDKSTFMFSHPLLFLASITCLSMWIIRWKRFR